MTLHDIELNIYDHIWVNFDIYLSIRFHDHMLFQYFIFHIDTSRKPSHSIGISHNGIIIDICGHIPSLYCMGYHIRELLFHKKLVVSSKCYHKDKIEVESIKQDIFCISLHDKVIHNYVFHNLTFFGKYFHICDPQ